MKIKSIFILITYVMLLSFCVNKSKEDKFWNWFSKNNLKYYKEFEGIDQSDPLFEKLNLELSKVNSELTWEFSPIKENGIREFTISADGIEKYFPAVEKLVNASPEIPQWKINAFRQRVPDDYMKIEYDDFSISHNDIFFKYAEEGNKIGLELYIRDYDGNGDKQNAIYILLDGLIGEYNVVKKIDWIEWKKLDESKLDQLFKFYEIRGLVDNLSD